ncbi:capsule biosynthesis protein [Sphingomonas sp. CJ99]
MPGPFFRMLAIALRAGGHRASRVHLCGGDWLDWRIGDATAYAGRSDAWPNWIAARMQGQGVTDLVLFGDCRPAHRAAILAARTAGIRVHVFEEGYLRPDHVTLESGGVNGHSALPRSIDAMRAALADNPVPVQPVAASFGRRAREAMAYSSASILGAVAFRHYRSHRPASALAEGLGWTRRWWRRGAERRNSGEALSAVAGRPFFLMPLQLDGDAQLVHHSPFDSMADALSMTIASFAAHAPTGTMLLVKLHPLDPDLGRMRSVTAALAARHGIGDRVAFIEQGDLHPLLLACRGVVTVNSTVGPLALAAGKPVCVLARAVYGLAGLVDDRPVDQFWADPRSPVPGYFDLFTAYLRQHALVNGGFHSPDGLALLVRNSVQRLKQTPC